MVMQSPTKASLSIVKDTYFSALSELEQEIQILSGRISLAQKAIPDFQSEEELMDFFDQLNLEEGLEHINLF